MQVSYTSKWIRSGLEQAIQGRITSPNFGSNLTFYDATHFFVSEGQRLIDEGIRKFKNRFDGEASADLDLGGNLLYSMATVDEAVNSRGQVIKIDNDEPTLRSKEELRQQSLIYIPIVDHIYGKRMVIFLNLVSLEDMRQAQVDDKQLLRINKLIDLLFEPHVALLRRSHGVSAPQLIKAIKIHFLGDAYNIAYRKRSFKMETEPYKALLKVLNISPISVPFHFYEGIHLNENIKHFKFILAQRISYPNGDIFLNSLTLKEIIQIAERDKQVIEKTFRDFYARLPLYPSPRINENRPGQDDSTITKAAATVTRIQEKEKQPVKMTPFQEWKKNNKSSNAYFPVLKLTDEDLATLNLDGRKGKIFSKYLEILKAGYLPHKEELPVEGRLFSIGEDEKEVNKEKEAYRKLNDYLQGLGITTTSVFSLSNGALCDLYFHYRKMKNEGKEFNFQDLKSELSEERVIKIAEYLFKEANEDKNYAKLARIDPGFLLTVYSDEFLENAFNLLIGETEEASIAHQNGYGQEQHTVRKTGNGKKNGKNILCITELRCPFLEEIGLVYEDYAERFPTKPELVRQYKRGGSNEVKNDQHKDVHALHMARFLGINIVLSNGEVHKGLPVKRAVAMHIIEELKTCNGKARIPDSVLKLIRRKNKVK